MAYDMVRVMRAARERRRRILKMRYRHGKVRMTLQQIADRLGVTKPRIAQILAKAESDR